MFLRHKRVESPKVVKKDILMTNISHQEDEQSSPHELQRKLSNRHLQLIAIGGAIGTGLFMGSGKTISLAGPSILIIYMIIGFMVFLVMRAWRITAV